MEEKTLEKTIEQIAREVSKHTGLIEKMDGRIDRLEKTTERLEKTTENIAAIVVDHSEKIKNLVTREEFDEKMDRVLHGQDKILAMVTHLEQERIFAYDRIERMEAEIKKIKEHLAMI